MESKEHKTLAAAFVAAQAEFPTVAKDRENPYFKSNYATLKAITEAVRPILARHGLGYSQGVAVRDGSAQMVTTVIHAASGERLESAVPYTTTSAKPQDGGSALTYAKRYGLQCALGVVVADDGDDDDGNRASGNAPQKPAPKPQPAPAAPQADYGVCPCGSVKGKRWGEIPTETLEKILATKASQVTEQHRAAIGAELKRRKAEAKQG